MEEKTNQELNKLWFDFYVKQLSSVPNDGFKKVDNYFICPCCQYPTLTSRNNFDICFLCNWEDDGQDDHNDDLVLGGPNQSYSLSEARQNFKQYLTSYRPTDKYHFERTTIKKTTSGIVLLDLQKIKRNIVDKYISVMGQENNHNREQVFKEIDKLAKQL
jgi:hypothetical protein